MAVYIDPLVDYQKKIGRNGPYWCHMTADTPKELHAFARQIKLRRDWYQDRPGHHHYDLTAGARARAVDLGAVELSPREYVEKNRAILATGAYDPPKKPYIAPTSVDEYNAAYMANHQITGSGFEVVTHFPCFACAAPDLVAVRIVATQEDLGKEAVCSDVPGVRALLQA
jgi:hypothetical protein